MTRDEINAYIRENWASAPSIKAISEVVGLSQRSVRDRADKMLLPRRPKRPANARIDAEEAMALAASGMSAKEIAAQFGVQDDSIRNVLRIERLKASSVNRKGFAERQEQARQLAKDPSLSIRKIAKLVGMSESSVIRAIAVVRNKQRRAAISDDPPAIKRNPHHKLTQRHKKILAMLAEVAREGWACPSNVQIADELDEDISSSSLSSVLEAMQKNGLLAIQRDPTTYGRRRIWLPEVGKWTDWTASPHDYRQSTKLEPRTCIRCRDEFLSPYPKSTHRFCQPCDVIRRQTHADEHSIAY